MELAMKLSKLESENGWIIPENIDKEKSKNDMETYRKGYPDDKEDNEELKLNLEFYQNKIESTPSGDFIDNIHNVKIKKIKKNVQKWFGDYELLEKNHSYV
jgi:hypothetical protein